MSLSGNRPIRMTLPCCSMGGFCSIWRMRCLDIAAANHELPALRRAAIRTLPAAPGSTRIEPDPDETFRSTAPVTLSVGRRRPRAPARRRAGQAKTRDRERGGSSEMRRTEAVAIMTTHDLPGRLDEKHGPKCCLAGPQKGPAFRATMAAFT